MKLYLFYVTRDKFAEHEGILYHTGADYMEGLLAAESVDDGKSLVSGYSYMKWDLSKDEYWFTPIGTADSHVQRGYLLCKMGKTGREWSKNKPCESPPTSRNAGNAA